MMVMNGQLELNLGLLSTEQQQKVDRFLADAKRRVEYNVAESKRKTETLLAAGFVLGKHFENTVEVEDVTEVHEFTLDWRTDETFEHEVSYQNVKGDVFIKTVRCEIEDDAIKEYERSTWFSLHSDGKIECSTIVGSYRAVKPETLLRKLGEYNEQQRYYAENKLSRINRDAATLKQLQELYPHATVLAKEHVYEPNSSRYSVKRIVVEFVDGSYANFTTNYKGDLECTYVYDVERDSLSNWDKVTIVSQRNK